LRSVLDSSLIVYFSFPTSVTPQRLFAVGLLDLYKAALENPRNTPEYLFDILMYMRDNYGTCIWLRYAASSNDLHTSPFLPTDLIDDALTEQQFWRTLVSILYNNAFVESTKRVAIELLIRFGDEVFLGIANDAEMFSRITNVLKSANPWPPERIPFTCSLLHVYGRILSAFLLNVNFFLPVPPSDHFAHNSSLLEREPSYKAARRNRCCHR
jgi:hypothetical protein